MCLNVEKCFFYVSLLVLVLIVVSKMCYNMACGGVVVSVNYRVFSLMNIYCAYSDKMI